MRTYIIKRLIQAIGICLMVSSISFFALFLHSDPALLLLPPEVYESDILAFKKAMGLDRPVIVQYLDYLKKVFLHADFGKSYYFRLPTIHLVAQKYPVTLKLVCFSMMATTLISISMGAISAIRRYSVWDNLATLIALVGQAMPLFWLGIMLQIVFGLWLGWFPISGAEDLKYYVLPAVTLTTFLLPINMRLVRSGMLDVLSKDYIRTARAKGLAEKKVIFKHAFKNAAIPLVTVMGLQFGILLGGTVVTETVFALPGLGRLAVGSIQNGDIPMVQTIVVVFALGVALANLAADIAAALLDPRIRLE